jgi:uracil-DNA glycosylase family 4
MARTGGEPGRNCPRCPRLVEFRRTLRAEEPSWFNAPVPSFGPANARLLIVGLAPGLQGANRTGRPFTGDYAGVLLYETLLRFKFARGEYKAHPDDGLELIDCRITNAVRCVPPQNKPAPTEIANCRDFLRRTIVEMPKLRAILALGRIAHESTLAALAVKKSTAPFAHGARHELDGVTLFASYHCSRYNTSTGVLTPEMFHTVLRAIRDFLG